MGRSVHVKKPQARSSKSSSTPGMRTTLMWMLQQWSSRPSSRTTIGTLCRLSTTTCKGRHHAQYSSNKFRLRSRLRGQGMKSTTYQRIRKAHSQLQICTKALINLVPNSRKLRLPWSRLQSNPQRPQVNLRGLKLKMSFQKIKQLKTRHQLLPRLQWHHRKRKRIRFGIAWILPTG